MPSSIAHYVNLATGRPYPLIPDEAVQLSSISAGWALEVTVELIATPPRELPEHGTLNNRAVVNLGPRVRYGWYDGDRPREADMGTGAMQILPHGCLNHPRCHDHLLFASLDFSPTLMEQLFDGSAPVATEVLTEHRNLLDPFAFNLTQCVIAELEIPTERTYAELLCLTMAMHLLRAYARRKPNVGTMVGRLSPGQARNVLDYIHANLGNRLSISSLAAEVGVSYSRFAHAFRSTFKEPPHRLILRWRLEQAQKLMLNGGLAPAEAALATGFCDQAHLTNAMRRYLRITPGELIRQRRGRL